MDKLEVKNHYYKHWTGLIKPKGLDVDHPTLTDTYGKFYIRPLERGYGLTLGNAIRRVLLNSMMGSAVSAVKFDGVVHEFTTLPDVLEDVTDIILNLKEVRFRQDNSEEHFLKISKTGKGEVTAGDIQCPPDIEVLNPSQHLATLGEKGKFSAEILVTFDRGYVQADDRKRNLPIGYVGMDAIHSPIRRVNYTVGSARVGQKTDYDSLVVEVWTDGSIKSSEALPLGYKILKEQLQVFINFDENIEPDEKLESEEQHHFHEALFRPVEDLELSVRSANCLKNAKIKWIGDLVTKSEQEMLKTKNFGRKSLNEIKDILKPMGFGLGMTIEGWPPKNLAESVLKKQEIGVINANTEGASSPSVEIKKTSSAEVEPSASEIPVDSGLSQEVQKDVPVEDLNIQVDEDSEKPDEDSENKGSSET